MLGKALHPVTLSIKVGSSKDTKDGPKFQWEYNAMPNSNFIIWYLCVYTLGLWKGDNLEDSM